MISKAAIGMLIGATALGALPAHAEPIWRDIEAGMTAEEVRALYPTSQGEGRKVEHNKRNIELHGFMEIGECKPRVEILHPQGLVTGVLIWMRKEGWRATCTEEARLALFDKFGSPDMDNTRRSVVPAFADLAQESLTWIKPGKTVEWRGGNEFRAWSIEYRAAPSSAADQL